MKQKMIADKTNRILFKGLNIIVPALIVHSFFILAAMGDPARHLIPLVLISGGIIISLALFLYLERNGRVGISPSVIMAVAILVRVFFVFQEPSLSDDIYRYYVDGITLLSGHNPYDIAPSAMTHPDPRLDPVLPLVNHPDLVTLYPPAAQIVFALGSTLGGIVGLKAFLVALDLITCLLIIGLLRKMKLPVSLALLYAWHPLPVLEIAGSGHIDGAALFFLFLAMNLVFRYSSLTAVLSGIFMAASVLTKLFPLVFVPGFICLVPKRFKGQWLSGFCLSIPLLCLPFFPRILHGYETLLLYSTRWEFSGFLFRTIRQIGFSGSLIRVFLAALFLVISLGLYSRVFRSSDRKTALKAFYLVAFSYLLLTPTLFPWYALYMVAFLPFCPKPSGMVLSFAVFLSYYILIPYKSLGIWEENDVIPMMIFFSPLAAMIPVLLSMKKKTISAHK